MKRSISELSASLCGRAEEVAIMLLPGGKRLNGSWIAGDIHGSEGKSLQVRIEGQYTGKWKDWGDSEEYRGDLLDLWRLSKNLSPRDTMREVKEFLGIHEPVSEIREKIFSAPKENIPIKPMGQIYQYLMAERELEAGIIQMYDLRAYKRGEHVFIAFPCKDPSGQIVNHSYRSLKPGEDGKKIVSQDKGCAPCLFGWQAMTEVDYASRSILLCEGHIDAMTWRQWGIAALSVPNGSGNTWIEYEWENLEMFQTIYLSYDMDGKTKDSLQKAIARLGKHRCLVVNLPKKDANDCLREGFGPEYALEWLKNASAPPMKDFVQATELKQRVQNAFYPDPEMQGIETKLFKGKSKESSFFIRPGEVSLWTGIAGHGKSTFLKDVFMELVHKNEKCMITSLEMRPEKIIKTMLKSAFGRELLAPSEIDTAIDEVGPQLFFYDKIGYANVQTLVETMEFAHCRHGVTQFMIDSLMRIDKLEEDYPAQGQFLNRLSEFTKTYGVHVHLVTHPKKKEDDETPTGNDIKGSSLLRNNADNILVVSRNFKKEKKRANGDLEEDDEKEWDARVMVEKDREEGYVKMFRYRYIPSFNRYIPLKD